MNRLFDSGDGLKKKYSFNNKINSMLKAFGISDERAFKINSFLSDITRKYSRNSEIIEIIANSDDFNDCEKILAIFMFGGFVQSQRSMYNKSHTDIVVHELRNVSTEQLSEIISEIKKMKDDD